MQNIYDTLYLIHLNILLYSEFSLTAYEALFENSGSRSSFEEKEKLVWGITFYREVTNVEQLTNLVVSTVALPTHTQPRPYLDW